MFYIQTNNKVGISSTIWLAKSRFLGPCSSMSGWMDGKLRRLNQLGFCNRFNSYSYRKSKFQSKFLESYRMVAMKSIKTSPDLPHLLKNAWKLKLTLINILIKNSSIFIENSPILIKIVVKPKLGLYPNPILSSDFESDKNRCPIFHQNLNCCDEIDSGGLIALAYLSPVVQVPPCFRKS